MSERVHLFVERWQPATLTVDHNFDPPMIFETPPRSLLRCGKCKRRRWAQHIEVQVYYDQSVTRCKAGYGCRKRKP